MKTPESITKLGFPELTNVSGLKSIAQEFGSSKPRCGIYLLALSEERYYIGQAVDCVRRFSQHLKTYEEIDGFSFIRVPKTKLDAREKELIFKAESADVTLLNVTHVSSVVGETDLDLLFEQGVLDRWLESPGLENQNDWGTKPIQLSRAHNERSALKFAELQRHPLAKAAQVQLAIFLETATPYPRMSEYSFWSVSAMPGTNKNTMPRMLCVSISVMEIFCVGYFREDDYKDLTWSFVNVASDVLFENFGSEEAFKAEYPYIEVNTERMYRDGGQYVAHLFATSQNDMIILLDDLRVSKAAAALCLRVMRKRPTIYSKYHCPQLADSALHYRTFSDEEIDREIESVLLEDLEVEE